MSNILVCNGLYQRGARKEILVLLLFNLVSKQYIMHKNVGKQYSLETCFMDISHIFLTSSTAEFGLMFAAEWKVFQNYWMYSMICYFACWVLTVSMSQWTPCEYRKVFPNQRTDIPTVNLICAATRCRGELDPLLGILVQICRGRVGAFACSLWAH